MFKKFIFILLLLVIISSHTTFSSAEKSVLVIQSYSQDFEWTNNFQKGITDSLLDRQMSISYQVEYLDTKRNFSEDYYLKLKELFSFKYSNQSFDAIIAIDNNALEFAQQYKQSIFNDAPIVAGGINNAKFYDFDEDTYIIAENIDYLRTIEYMKTLNNRLEKVYIVLDDTNTGRSIKREILGEIANQRMTFDMKVEFITDKTIDEISAWSKNLSDREGLIYLLYFVDGQGNRLNYQEGINSISKSASIPIFTVWDFYTDEGVIGGYLTSPYLHGQIVGNTTKDLLLGKSIMPLRNDLYNLAEPVLDYQVYQEYLDYFTKIPSEVTWINRPESYFERNRELILVFLSIISVLMIIIFLITLQMKNQKAVNEKDKIMREMQSQLIYTLGDVIESRSGETANHVRRVSEIAEFIAIKSGHKEISEMILITSPLHDLGKIGIPDKILLKPGPLTDEEYEEMKKHTEIGYHLLKNKNSEVLSVAATIAYQHQELYNGSGYPQGLKGNEISIYARIVTLADVYDALRSKRVYKDAWPINETLDYLSEQKGLMFDPVLVDILVNNIDAIEEIRENSSHENEEKEGAFNE